MFISLYSFGIHIQGDVLENVEHVRAWESYVLRSIFLLIMATHTPFIFFIGKESILDILRLIYKGRTKKRPEDSYISEQSEESILDQDNNSTNVTPTSINAVENGEKFKERLESIDSSSKYVINDAHYSNANYSLNAVDEDSEVMEE